MTKSRSAAGRVLLGLLGTSAQSSHILREWNRSLRDRGIDGSMDRYPCTGETLPERLSEMVHFDRRGYIVTAPLQELILPLLDRLDATAEKRHAVDTVVNEGGVLTGYDCKGDDGERRKIWFRDS